MPRLAILLVAAVTLLAALLLSGILDPAAAPPPRVDAADGAAPAADLSPPTDELADVEPVGSRRTSNEAPIAPTEVDATDDTPCILIGRFVDEEGAPLAGLLVQLGAWKTWSEDDDAAAPLETFRGRPTDGMVGFECETDTDGAFRFETTTPTGRGASLYAAGDRFVDSHSERFGYSDAQSRPALTSGLRDLGTIQLVATGALFGRVTDAGGAPIAGAEVGIGPTRSTTYSRDVVTDADGRFVVAHAPVGTYGIEAEDDAYVSEFREPFTVEAGRDTGPIDFALELAPTITGRVADSEGNPIEGARVGGWPESSGSGAWTRSVADGSFALALPQDEPYTLEATHPDHATWGDDDDRDTLYEPGTAGLEITMAPAEKTRFVVVGAADGAPLERFGLRVYPDEGSAADRSLYTERRRPRLEDHPGGVLETRAREGVDAVLAWAEGHVLTEVDVEHDEAGSGTQTLRLPVGATITGRVLEDGAPVADASVEVSAPRRRNGHVSPETVLRGTTGPDGRFAIRGVARGTRTLTVQPPGGAAIVREGLLPEPPETLDVGDLEVVDGGTITGVCHLPAGIEPAGLTIYLDGWQQKVTARTDSAGRFRFEDVSPGEHELSSDERPGVLEGGARASVTVESGATVNAEIDLTRHVLHPVEIEVVYGALPLAEARVLLAPIEPEPSDGSPFGRNTIVRVGQLDEDGVARGFARAHGRCTLELAASVYGRIRVPDVVVDLDGSGPVRVRVELDLASAVLALPAEAVLPLEGTLEVRVEGASENPLGAQTLRIPVRAGRVDAPGVASLTGGVLTVHGLSPGGTRVAVSASEKDAPRVATDLGGGVTSYGPEQLWSFGADVGLTAGEVTEVTLR